MATNYSLRLAPPKLALATPATGRHLIVDSEGTPVQLRGEAAWSAVTGRLTGPAKIDQYLNDRQSRSFNAILIESIESGTYGGPTNAGGSPFGASNFTTFNESYWQQHDYIIRGAAARGMYVLDCVAYWGRPESEGWAVQMRAAGTGAMGTYGNFLRDRYANDSNIIWMLGGDERRTDDSGVQAGLFAALAAGLGSSKLITYHGARNSSAFDGSPAYATLNNTYTSKSTLSQRVLADYLASSPIAATFHVEGDYNGDFLGSPTANAKDCRVQAWQSFLSGGCGHFFGDHTIWQFLSGWEAALSNDASVGFQRVCEFFKHRQHWRLVPDSSSQLITAGRGSDGTGYVSAALANDRSFGVAVVPAGGLITANLAQLGGSAVAVSYIDPHTGQKTAATGSPFTKTSRSFTASSERGNNANGGSDQVVLFEAQ